MTMPGQKPSQKDVVWPRKFRRFPGGPCAVAKTADFAAAAPFRRTISTLRASRGSRARLTWRAVLVLAGLAVFPLAVAGDGLREIAQEAQRRFRSGFASFDSGGKVEGVNPVSHCACDAGMVC